MFPFQQQIRLYLSVSDDLARFIKQCTTLRAAFYLNLHRIILPIKR